VATATTPLNAPVPPSIDGVDRLYHQLAKIHTITIVQLAKCVCWCRSDSTSSPIHARAGWLRPVVDPFVVRMASPSTDFSP
jgi:hypothetical protein